MLQSKLFTKTSKEAPKDEISANAQLLIRAGFVDKLMAGVYTYLPLGFRVLKKIEDIIRDEMTKAGGQEIFMPALQPKENWTKTGRWDSMDDLYKIKDLREKEFALGPTHEEVIFPLLKKNVFSYKDLPLYVYQIQNKFRMELRSKSGLLRGREFLMKDFYSFHSNEEDRDKYYDFMAEVYKNVFNRTGIGEKTYYTLAGGGTFSKFSHEFQTVTEAGEDIIFVCDKCNVAVNKEIINEQNNCPDCGNKNLIEKKSIEVGNIFKLKDKFAEDFNLKFKDDSGLEKIVATGCYGIGLGRLMGAIVEIHHDDKGIIWPAAVAPFKVHLVRLNAKHEIQEKIIGLAEKIYNDLQKEGIEVLFDDRELSVGEKLADSDLIGLPYRVIVSERNLKGDNVELIARRDLKSVFINKNKIIEELKNI